MNLIFFSTIITTINSASVNFTANYVIEFNLKSKSKIFQFNFSFKFLVTIHITKFVFSI